MTIEEAWKAIDIVAPHYSEGNQYRKGQKDRIREALMAVLEETAIAAWKDFGTGVMTTEDRPEVLLVCARIAALGKADDGR